MTFRRVALLIAIAAVQFVIFESALRAWGHSEAAPAFQGLFVPDALLGYRLQPNARTRFETAEFSATIAINAEGVRDDRPIGPKPPGEKRIVVLGDSLVLSVQVDRDRTFCQLLEDRLNARPDRPRYRVINAGVQGYGPVQELLFYQSVARAFQADLVLDVVFVGNDAEDAAAAADLLHGDRRPSPRTAVTDSLAVRARRIVRQSMVLQLLRLRIESVTSRLPSWRAAPEPPLQTYAAKPNARIEYGLRVSREAIGALAREAATTGARTAVVLMPARFQLDDADYGHLDEAVRQAGGTLLRNAGSERFAQALAPLGLPLLDLLPAMHRALPGPDLFYQQTAHLTPRGHEVVAGAIDGFLRANGF